MKHDSFADHCREIVQRFLLTAVVVDDELSASPDARDLGEAARSGRPAARAAPPSVDPPSPPSRPLKVKPVTESFADAGMVCGVLPPPQDDDGLDTIAKAIAPADIIILDWRLSRDTGANALPLLERVLVEDQPHRLRLIAFYTGETLPKVRNEVIASLNSLSGPDRVVSTRSDGNGAIDFGPCRIVVYAKPDSYALEPGAVVQEEDLANRLICDFADRIDGLLPVLARISHTWERKTPEGSEGGVEAVVGWPAALRCGKWSSNGSFRSCGWGEPMGKRHLSGPGAHGSHEGCGRDGR